MNQGDMLKERLNKIWEETLYETKIQNNKENYQSLYDEAIKDIISNYNENYQTIFDAVTDDYLKEIKGVAKLSPGLATGLQDLKYDINFNVYTGYTNDGIDKEKIATDTPFDVASMTKLFTSILLLKEEEKGNIELKRCYSDYSDLLINVDIPIIKALKFGTEIRTPGRIDEINITPEERINRFKKAYIYKRDNFIYSDVPFMLVLMLFGKNEEEANINYINKFYDLYRGIELNSTGYFVNYKTGGILSINNPVEQVEVYDPKARRIEIEKGYILGHAGVTTTVEDIQKLFKEIINGLLSKESINKLITPIIKDEILKDENGNPILRKGKKVYINRAMGVYINIHDIRKCDIAEGYSDKTFAASGSTGCYSVFDLDNQLSASLLSNIKTTSYTKTIFTDNYIYGDNQESLPKFYKTSLIAGTGTKKDGMLIKEDGSEMTYSKATNHFKEVQFKTLLKLRFAKKVLLDKVQNEKDKEMKTETINKVFNKTVTID